ncbi:MAG: uracil-DNA glycosylase [Chloroflexi bacterium]|nr:MAG: uracil-DNA glycosylase [Chloroflexota bacterium]
MFTREVSLHVRAEASLERLHARIRVCTRCVDAGLLKHARPIVAGSILDRIAIVGQAPGAVELSTGQPFSGRSGAELRRWLARAGIDEDHLPYRTAITKCFPGKSAAGGGDRRPSPAEIGLCAPWLQEELALLRPRVILLVGGLAIERFWGKMSLEVAVGTSRRIEGVTYIALPHPSGASRWLNDARHRLLLTRALAKVSRAVRTLDNGASEQRIRDERPTHGRR